MHPDSTIPPTVTLNTKRAILYARVSGDDRRSATSGIDAQLTKCKSYCEERGYRIVGEAVEEPNRQTSEADWLPELERVVKLAPTGTFDVLVCCEVDRLARNRFKQMATEIELESHGVAVEYAVGQYEDTPEGRLFKGMVSEFAEYERDKIRRRVQRGILDNVALGNVTTGGAVAPYGYDLVRTTDPATGKPRRSLTVNNYAASVVRQMFDLYAGGASLRAVCEWLVDQRVPLPGKGNNQRGDGLWHVSAVSRILSDETYTGTWHYCKTRRVKNPKTGKYGNKRNPREKWLEIAVPRIVTDDLFDTAQRRKAANIAQMGHQRSHTYAIGGMVTCSHCGKSVTGIAKYTGKKNAKRRDPYLYYVCSAYHNRKIFGYRCDLPSFRADHVDAAVWRWVKSLLLEPDTLRRQLLDYQNQERDRVQPQLAMLESSQARLGELEGRKERLIAAYTSGVLTLDELAAQKVTLDKEIGTLAQAIAGLRAETERRVLSAEQITGIEELAAEIRTGADVADADLSVQREISRQLRVQVTLGYDGQQRWIDAACVLRPRPFVSGTRREFVRSLWRLYGDDRRWVPPYHPLLGRVLKPGACPHIERLTPVLIHLDALPQRKTSGGYSTALMEEPVAATALLVDPRRRDGTGYLALLECANDAETFEHLMGVAMEQAAMQGCRRLWGPVALSPHLGAGMLESHFHLMPPLHSPYNPPYLPEAAAGVMEPAIEGAIVRLPVGERMVMDGPARLCATTADRLAADLLPLLAAACAWGDLFPRPDAEEAAFLANWLGVWPLLVWTAEVEGESVGLLVIQPDVAGSVARARGGRNPLWRVWLGWQVRRPVRAGRVLWLGVLPKWRGRGIGKQMWAHAVSGAVQAGWQELTVGPLPAQHPFREFLAKQGATGVQRIVVYEMEL